MGTIVLTVCCFSACKTPMSQFSMASYRPVVGVGAINVPTLADLEVSQTKIFEKIEKKIENNKEIDMSKAVENAVNTVMAELLLKRNADVLIQPVFAVDSKWGKSKTTITITVSGYPATYKNFRSMTREDAILFKDINIYHIPNGVVVSEQYFDPNKKK